MGLGEGIRECVADVGVQTNDINTAAITSKKINCSAGRWSSGVMSTAGLTVAFTFQATTAVTITECIVQITAASSAGFIGPCGTAGAAFYTASITLATTYRNMFLTCAVGTVSAGSCIVIELSAGGTFNGAISGANTANSLRGKYFIHYITTPT